MRRRTKPITLAVPLGLTSMALAVLAWLLATGTAQAATCDVPTGTHPTIQSAVHDGSCDTIKLTDALYIENVIITRSVTIEGRGEVSTTVDGDRIGSVFTIQPGLMATLMDMTITHGEALDGGGIHNSDSTVVLEAVTVISNTAFNFGSGGGGGIFTDDGDMHISNSTIINNLATDASGGGIYNVGRLTVIDSIISGNSTGAGGGIFHAGGSLNVSNSTLSNNSASSGGGMFLGNGPNTIVDTTLSDNSAVNKGGGMYVQIFDSREIVTVFSGTFSNNSAQDGGGINILMGAVTLNDTTVRDNTATNNGGGILQGDMGGPLILNNVKVHNNKAVSGRGGGIMASTCFSLALNNSTVSNNTAESGAGGGIYIGFITRVTLNSSAVIGNSAVTAAGIIADSGGGPLIMNNSTVSGNVATGTAGAVAGIIANNNGLSLINSTVSGNMTADAAGTNDVGGIQIDGAIVNLNNSTVANNSANSVGGISLLNGLVTMQNTILAENTARTGSDPDCSGTIHSGGHNLLGSTSVNCTFDPRTGDITNSNPLIGPLGNNGGDILTHALLFGSPAIDAASPAAPGSGGNPCETTDQRSVSRPLDGDSDGVARCDIGAFELDPRVTIEKRGPAVAVAGSPIQLSIRSSQQDGYYPD